MNKETVHPTIGSKVRLINKPIWVGAYEEGETGVVIERDVFGDAAPYGYILVVLDRGVDYTYNIPHGQYEVIADEQKKGSPEYPLEKDISAETIRSNILSIREKRDDLLMEIAALDKEEAEFVEKLKQQGFVLYEDNVPKEIVATEKKTMLFAEDIEEDMTDPRNLQVGDVIECLSTVLYPRGTLAVVTDVEGTMIYRKVEGEKVEGHFDFANFGDIWKFHSRPVVK